MPNRYTINPESISISLYVNEDGQLSHLPDLRVEDETGEHWFALHILCGKRGDWGMEEMNQNERRTANILMARRIGLALKLMHEMEKTGVIDPANLTAENSIPVELTGYKKKVPASLSL